MWYPNICGPNTCGTPDSNVRKSPKKLLTFTFCFLRLRYEQMKVKEKKLKQKKKIYKEFFSVDHDSY